MILAAGNTHTIANCVERLFPILPIIFSMKKCYSYLTNLIRLLIK